MGRPRYRPLSAVGRHPRDNRASLHIGESTSDERNPTAFFGDQHSEEGVEETGEPEDNGAFVAITEAGEVEDWLFKFTPADRAAKRFRQTGDGPRWRQ